MDECTIKYNKTSIVTFRFFLYSVLHQKQNKEYMIKTMSVINRFTLHVLIVSSLIKNMRS